MAEPVAEAPRHQTVDQLVRLDGAQRVLVHDRWWGMGTVSTSRLSIALVRNDRGGFAGELQVVIDGAEEKSMRVEVQPRAAKSLLRHLSNARILRGPYSRRFEHTDDYPSIELVVDSGAGFVYFFSESQGDHHVPWGACINGELFALPDEDVGLALQALRGLVTGEGLRKGLLAFLRRKPRKDRNEGSPDDRR